MTITPASVSAIAEMIGDTPEVTMMIGIGLQKESDAVYFQYMGDDQTQALMLPSGNTVTRLQNIRVVGLSVAEEVGTFKSTKLNVIIESTNGTQVMLTSGLTTLWSQFLICGLSALYNEYGLDQAVTLNTWKGTSSMRPCFAAIYQGKERLVDDQLKTQLQDARSDRDQVKVLAIMRDTVGLLSQSLGGADVIQADVSVDEPVTDLF